MGLDIEPQLAVSVCYDGIVLEEAFRVDVLVDKLIVRELKSIKEFTATHYSQLLTYLKFTNNHVGFLLNFNTDLMKNGTRRLVQNHF